MILSAWVSNSLPMKRKVKLSNFLMLSLMMMVQNTLNMLQGKLLRINSITFSMIRNTLT